MHTAPAIYLLCHSVEEIESFVCLLCIHICFDNVKVNKSKYYGIISVLFSILYYENSVMGCFVGKTVSRSLASNFKAQTEAKLQIQEDTLEHSKQ